MSSSENRRVRVLVVDDSALVRKAITDALSQDPELEVVGSACDPYVAREKIVALDPDVLTLDLEMPRMDGLTFLRILMQHHPLPVVVVSSLTQAGSRVAMEALDAGAVDVLGKPGSTSVGDLAGRLAFHVKAAAASARFRTRRLRDRVTAKPEPVAAPPAAASPRFSGRIDSRQVIVIGSSTGGIEALRTVLPKLPEGVPPIVVVQHISPYFSKVVAERLDAICPFPVREAEDGMHLRRGTCVIAPGDHHVAVRWDGEGYRAQLNQGFRSAAEAGGRRVVAALLTGMGSDGAAGMQAIRKAGGVTIAEHERTCVVYGMPRAAIQLGVVDHVVPLPQIAETILEAVSKKPA